MSHLRNFFMILHSGMSLQFGKSLKYQDLLDFISLVLDFFLFQSIETKFPSDSHIMRCGRFTETFFYFFIRNLLSNKFQRNSIYQGKTYGNFQFEIGAFRGKTFSEKVHDQVQNRKGTENEILSILRHFKEKSKCHHVNTVR